MTPKKEKHKRGRRMMDEHGASGVVKSYILRRLVDAPIDRRILRDEVRNEFTVTKRAFDLHLTDERYKGLMLGPRAKVVERDSLLTLNLESAESINDIVSYLIENSPERESIKKSLEVVFLKCFFSVLGNGPYLSRLSVLDYGNVLDENNFPLGSTSFFDEDHDTKFEEIVNRSSKWSKEQIDMGMDVAETQWGKNLDVGFELAYVFLVLWNIERSKNDIVFQASPERYVLDRYGARLVSSMFEMLYNPSGSDENLSRTHNNMIDIVKSIISGREVSFEVGIDDRVKKRLRLYQRTIQDFASILSA